MNASRYGIKEVTVLTPAELQKSLETARLQGRTSKTQFTRLHSAIEIRRETEKAVLVGFRVLDNARVEVGNRDLWVPKSALRVDDSGLMLSVNFEDVLAEKYPILNFRPSVTGCTVHSK